jgi:RNA polymerase sigma factor (TIGR02999 family)
MWRLDTDHSRVPEFAELFELARDKSISPGDNLIARFYPELRRIAVARMRTERPEHTWQPTVLLSELYLELRKIKRLRPVGDSDQEKHQFLSLAAHLMKRLLIHHARRASYQAEKVPVEDSTLENSASGVTLQDIELALSRLGNLDPRLRDVVQMKVFQGLTEIEIAKELQCAPRTVARYWNFAKQWLQRELC